MPAPPFDRSGPNYDRWTFDRWAAGRTEQRRAARRRLARVAAGLVLLAGLGWAICHHRAVSPTPPPSATGGAAGALRGVTVVLDPGHGGEDPGASLRWGRQSVHEAALTYRTADAVALALRDEGARVRYTVRSRLLEDGAGPLPDLPADAVMASTGQPLRLRRGRSPRQLWARADLARQVWEAAVRTDPQAARDIFFLSVHYDQSRDSQIHGGLVCVDRRGGPPPAFGLALARDFQAQGWARPDTASGDAADVSADDLGVLNPRYNPVPQRALLEVATLSNLDDYLRATDPVWRGRVAHSITQSVIAVHREGKQP